MFGAQACAPVYGQAIPGLWCAELGEEMRVAVVEAQKVIMVCLLLTRCALV